MPMAGRDELTISNQAVGRLAIAEQGPVRMQPKKRRRKIRRDLAAQQFPQRLTFRCAGDQQQNLTRVQDLRHSEGKAKAGF